MKLVNNTIVETAYLLLEKMTNKVVENNTLLLQDSSRYDLRSEVTRCNVWMDQIRYHLSDSKKNGKISKYDLSGLRQIVNRFGPLYLVE